MVVHTHIILLVIVTSCTCRTKSDIVLLNETQASKKLIGLIYISDFFSLNLNFDGVMIMSAVSFTT